MAMFIDFLIAKLEESPETQALVWDSGHISRGDLLGLIHHWRNSLMHMDVKPGTVVALEGDFSPNCIALFLALTDMACIIVPKSSSNPAGATQRDNIAQVELSVCVDSSDQITWTRNTSKASHQLYTGLREGGFPGLLLFSSGTSGEPKAALHNFANLLEKFKVRRPGLSTLNFLLFDHWGGLNTMLHTLSNQATIVTVRDRSPETVCRLIEAHSIEVLPATPTFLNLLLLSRVYQEYNLSSLKVISYGTEPMQQNTLERLGKAFPQVKLQQTYGLIEVGVLRTKSKDNGSLWMKLGGEGYNTRVVDGVLQIKAASTILGYLNAPTPITSDGWFVTGDQVEQDGEYFRILGRKCEIINVGGEKVYPVEVESVIQSIEGVLEATVFGEKNPIMGNIVCAKVRSQNEVDKQAFVQKIKAFCREKLERFKVPAKIIVVQEELFGDRFKKVRTDLTKLSE